MRWWRALILRGRPVFSISTSDSDSDSTRPVPSGFLPIYVGQNRLRFVIPIRFINLPIFASLLEWAEEEYGSQPRCGLSLPCDVGFFRWVLSTLEKDEGRFKGLGLHEFLKVFSELGLDSSCNHGSTSIAASFSGLSPLPEKARH